MTNIQQSRPFIALYLPLSSKRSSRGKTVLRDSGVQLPTRIRRRVGLVGAVLCLVGAAVVPGAAQADRRPAQEPEELWRAYPLEQTPTTSAPAPASPARTGGNPAPSTTDTSASDPPRLLLAAFAAASALLAGTVWTLRRRRRAPAVVDRTEPPVSGPIPPRAVAPPPPAVAPAARTTPTAAARANAATPGANAATAQANARTKAAAARANGRPAGRSKGPVCQIRWSRRGRWFYAVRIDPDGAEHRIGRSPRVDCDEPAPPGETPEARAALRQLVKDLRRGGWRPLRARGIDFEERRWYARRFRWPTEAEVVAGDPDASDRRQ
jgi:hypothetical protein